MKFSSKDFFSKCEQTRKKLRLKSFVLEGGLSTAFDKIWKSLIIVTR